MIKEKIFGEVGSLSNADMLGDNSTYAIQTTIEKNNAVGTIVGYYDENLTILSVSNFLLYNLGYSYEEFVRFSHMSLKNIFYGENISFLKEDRFPFIHGMGEGDMLTKDGTPMTVRLYKEDSVDKDGTPVWVMSVRIDWEHENLTLINGVIKSGLWYFDCDKEGNISEVHWSHAFRKMLGYQDIYDFPNELSSWSELLHPMDKESILDQLMGAIADTSNEKKYNVEYRLKMKDGTYQWFRANAEIIRRNDRTARRITGIFVNIDSEKKAVIEKKKSEAFHRAFTKTNLCEYFVNLKENTFDSMKLDESLLADAETGKTWDELIEFYVNNYVCDEYKTDVKQFYKREYIKRRINEINGEINLESCIFINGQKHWVRNVILQGNMEDTDNVIVFLRDITDAKREAELHKELSVENEAMGHLIQSVTRIVDHFAVCDLKNDTYVYNTVNINSNYKTQGRYSDFIKEVTNNYKILSSNETMYGLLMPDNIRANLKSMKDVYKFEYCSQDEDVFRSASFVPIECEKDIITKVLWVSNDITKEKNQEIKSRKALKDAYQAAERANRAKTEFLNNMSHDIRTPMNAIVGLTAIAGANVDNQDKVLECLTKMTGASRHLLGLINEVLDMARIESGKISLSEDAFNLSELVDNLISMAKPGIDEHGHELEINIKNIEHEDVYGDALRIQQIFMNLMSNAIKYTPNGGKVSFSIEEKPNGHSELGCYVFTIEDNGIGMDKDFQKIMFQPFTRADDNRTTKIQGTGLGMTITRNIVSMMNGNIKVWSEPGKGSKFTVTILLRLQNNDIDKVKELTNLPVLVVDDDISSCEGTVATLKEIGIAGEYVTSGEEAIKRTFNRHEKNDDYFAIIMDWKMPDMDGIETTRRIRKRIGKDVTIIVLTAYDYSEIEAEARKAGVDAFITKPLFRSRITAAFMKIVSDKPNYSSKDYLMEIKSADYSDKCILIVEDNELNREIASEIIGMTDVKVETAENGKEAVEKIESSHADKFDLVFMDIQMPVMNGYEATAAIRSLPDKRSGIPIIAMTANAFAEDVQLAKNTGMNEHIAKPLEFSKLNAIMKKYLKPGV